jgi:predicted PhzF superfamily epimerase YddE/YHI9
MPAPADPPVAVAYHHVDVFSAVAYAGNSVAVIVDPPPLTTAQMALITRELRHFETVFVQTGPGSGQARARVFDLAGELDFAGHPVLGTAAVLHQATGEERSLAQGRFVGRPSRLAITAYGSPDAVERVTVGGDVAAVATGFLRQLPGTG